MADMANQRWFQAGLPVFDQRIQMTVAVSATNAPQRMRGLPEFLAIARRLRSICSVMISKLRSAVIFTFASIVVYVLMIKKCCLVLLHLIFPPAERSESMLFIRIALQR